MGVVAFLAPSGTVAELLGAGAQPKLALTILTFGFKNGPPRDADPPRDSSKPPGRPAAPPP